MAGNQLNIQDIFYDQVFLQYYKKKLQMFHVYFKIVDHEFVPHSGQAHYQKTFSQSKMIDE